MASRGWLWVALILFCVPCLLVHAIENGNGDGDFQEQDDPLMEVPIFNPKPFEDQGCDGEDKAKCTSEQKGHTITVQALGTPSQRRAAAEKRRIQRENTDPEDQRYWIMITATATEPIGTDDGPTICTLTMEQCYTGFWPVANTVENNIYTNFGLGTNPSRPRHQVTYGYIHDQSDKDWLIAQSAFTSQVTDAGKTSQNRLWMGGIRNSDTDPWRWMAHGVDSSSGGPHASPANSSIFGNMFKNMTMPGHHHLAIDPAGTFHAYKDTKTLCGCVFTVRPNVCGGHHCPDGSSSTRFDPFLTNNVCSADLSSVHWNHIEEDPAHKGNASYCQCLSEETRCCTHCNKEGRITPKECRLARLADTGCGGTQGWDLANLPACNGCGPRCRPILWGYNGTTSSQMEVETVRNNLPIINVN